MLYNKKKYLIFFVFLISVLSFFLYANKLNKENKAKSLEPIVINLLTSVHPSLLWNFKPAEAKIYASPGEVVTIDYVVENIGKIPSTGIATFSYYPKEFGNYITKLNCFCYDAQTLKSKQKDKYSIVLLIDPEVTKDSKTKKIKEITIQFIFFDYKKYKESKS
jgi:cytochrome c oxidase assembly protein subunit 11